MVVTHLHNSLQVGLLLNQQIHRLLHSLFDHAAFRLHSLGKDIPFHTQKDGNVIIDLEALFLSQFLHTVDDFSGHALQLETLILFGI